MIDTVGVEKAIEKNKDLSYIPTSAEREEMYGYKEAYFRPEFQQYFGNLQSDKYEEESNIFGEAVRAFARGTDTTVTGINKLYLVGSNSFKHSMFDVFRSQKYDLLYGELERRNRMGVYSKEEYEELRLNLDKRFVKDIAEASENATFETEEAKQLVDAINKYSQKRINESWYREKKGDGFVGDVFASAPTMLAGLGVALLTKNPVWAAATMAAISAASTAGDVVSSELENGNTLQGSLSTGIITGASVGSLDAVGGATVASMMKSPLKNVAFRNQVLNNLLSWVKGKNNTSLTKYVSRVMFGAGVEEFGTETTQSIIQANLPRIIGKGEEWQGFFDEMKGYAYEGLVGAFSGGLLGGTGAAISYSQVHSGLKKTFIAQGQDVKEATELANVLTPTIIEHMDEIKKETSTYIANEVTGQNKLNELSELDKILLGGLTNEERAEIDHNHLQKLNRLFPNSERTNKITAQLLTQKQIIEADLLGEKASEVDIKVEEGSQDIQASDKFLHDVQGGEIQGATPKDIASNMIYIVNGASAETLLHEAAHQYLNSVSKVLNKNRVRAIVNPTIAGIIDVIGEADENGMFSTEQQEKFAKTLTDIILSGEIDIPSLEGAITGTKTLVNTIYKSAEKNNQNTDNLKIAYSKIFAKDIAKEPAWALTEERIEALKKAVDDIKKGNKITYEQVKMLASLIKFGQGYIPAFGSVNLAEFIKNNPQYNTLKAESKLELLRSKGFNVERNTKLYPTAESFVEFLEQNAENVETKNAEEIKAKKQRFEDYKAAYIYITGGTRTDIVNLATALRQVTRAGLSVVSKENIKTLNKTVKDLQKSVSSLEKEAEATKEKLKDSKEKLGQYHKKEVNQAKKITYKLIEFINQLQASFNLIGEDIGGLDALASKAKENARKGKLDELNKFNKEAVERLQDITNRFYAKYYKSNAFLTVNEIEPPIVNEGKVISAITKAIMQNADFTDPNNTAKIIKDLTKTLTSLKVPVEVRSEIIEGLVRNYQQIATGDVSSVVTSVLDSVNKNYQNKMKEKINSSLKSLFSSAKKGEFDYETNVILKFIQDNISEYRKYLKKPNTWSDANYEFWQQRKNFDGVITKDPNGKEIKLNDGQKKFLSQLLDYETSLANERIKSKNIDFKPLNNTELIDLFRNVEAFASITADYTAKLEEAERQKFGKRTKELLDIVEKRKVIKGFTGIDSFIFAGPVGGLRSNLIVLFGEEEASRLDVTIEDRYRNIAVRKFQDRLNAVIEKQTGKSVWGYRGRLDSKIPFKHRTDKIGKALSEYNKGQLLQLYLIFKNEIGKRHINNHFTDVLGENAGQQVIDYIIKNKGLSRIDISVGDEMMRQLEELYPSIAQVFFNINKVPLGRQSNYWPVKVKVYSGKNDLIQDDITMFELKIDEDKGWNNTMRRVGPNKKNKLILDNPFDTYERYLQNANKFIFMTEKINELSKLILGKTKQAEELRDKIQEKFGEDFLNAIKADIQYMLGVEKTESASRYEKFFNEIVSNWVIAKLGMKVWVGVKQIPAFLNYAERMNTGTFATYAFKAITNPVKTYKMLEKEFPSFNNRRVGALPMAFFDNKSMLVDTMLGNSSMLRKVIKNENTLARIAQYSSWMKNKATANVRWGDTAAVVFGGGAYVMYLKDQIEADPIMSKWSDSMKNQYIEEKFIEATETTQQSGLMSARGKWQRGNSPLMRAIMSFSSANAQFARKAREAVYQFRNDEISFGEFVRRIIIYMFLQPLTYAILSQPDTFKKLLERDEDEEYNQYWYRGVIRPFVENMSNSYGSLGNVLLLVSDKLAKRYGQQVWASDNTINPGVLEDLTKIINTMFKEDKTWEDTLDGILGAMEFVAPVPLQTGKKMIKGAYGFVFTDEQILNMSRMLGLSENQVKKLLEENE